ncbi:MAG: co-chaperone GroES [Patescibacteria group bacterium]
MTIKPLGNRVVVRMAKQKNTTSSGIILSTEEKNEQALGEIISIGAGFGEENVQEMGLSEGQTVMFGKYSGEEVKDDTDSEIIYKIINGKDILAIIEN